MITNQSTIRNIKIRNTIESESRDVMNAECLCN